MKIDSAILADYVQENGGKLYIVGGGIDTIFSNSAPIKHPSMGLAFRIILSPAELGRTHQMEILLVNADGGRIATVNAKIQAERSTQENSGWPVSISLAINITQIEFPSFGEYQFDLMINNSSIHQIPFRVVRKNPSAS